MQFLCAVFLKTQTKQNPCKKYDGPESMMPHTISLPVPEKKCRGDHLGHMALTIYTNIGSPFQGILHIKIDFVRPSGF